MTARGLRIPGGRRRDAFRGYPGIRKAGVNNRWREPAMQSIKMKVDKKTGPCGEQGCRKRKRTEEIPR
jgi:hypothetical protein